jgi:carbonic anhydrase
MKAFLSLPLLALIGAAAHAAPPSAAAPASAASVPAGNEAIERLYQRLAEKLGSVRQPTDDGSLLLRVPSRAEAAPAKAARKHASAETPPGGQWSYEGATGPQAWGRLKPEYARCASGTRQSPIDIRDGFKVQLDPIEFDYRASPFRVLDNGHAIQVTPAPGSTIDVLGRRYALQQFHLHRPSETRIDGRSFEMELHLVHQDEAGRLAVVAVLLEQGTPNSALQMALNHLPLEKGEEQAARVPIDLKALLPQDRRYYSYMGSLTTPPCSEGVLWLVLKQPMPMSAEQLALFARLYAANARPVQPGAGRMVKESM